MNKHRVSRQRGFNMIELLMAAFILGFGILGLTLLQVSAMRVNTSSANTSRALSVADRVLETVAMEGRRSMLWKTEGRSPTVASYSYLNSTGTVTRYVTPSGKSFATVPTATQTGGEMYFTTKVVASDTIACTALVSSVTTTLGRSSIFSVEVSYADAVVSKNGTTTVVPRVVRLARRVSHA